MQCLCGGTRYARKQGEVRGNEKAVRELRKNGEMRWLVISILFLFIPQQDEYKWGVPTSKGIDNYVERNQYQFVIDYQNFIGDTLYFEPFISTDDLSDYYDYNEGTAGFFERPDNIVISNEPRYLDYEVQRLSDYQKSRYKGNNLFVRAVVMHELTHAYIYQIMMVAQHNKNLEYKWRQGLGMIPVNNYYTGFMEEGICEVVVQLMQEMICYEDDIGISKSDLSRAKRKNYEVKYRYGSQFVKPIILEYGLKPAIYLILSNKPPSKEEILEPNLYYQRLCVVN